MKKNLFIILVCSIIFFCITGCNNLVEKDKDDIHSFTGTIIECQKKHMIVRPNKDEEEYNSSDKFKIEYVLGFNSCSVDAKVKITYKGMIDTSYPAQIGTTKIEID